MPTQRRRRRARPAVAQGDLQRRDEPARRAHAAHARPRLRAPDLRALVTGLVDEGKAVAAAQGSSSTTIPSGLIDHAARKDVAYDHKASMLQDVEARRPTESTT
jgi:ketopantoate reductase